MMIATQIYHILNNYRKNPHQLLFDGSVIIHQLNDFIAQKLPIQFIFPACHGKVNNPQLVIDHLPDMGEYLGIQNFSQMCLEINALYPPGCKLIMVHEGHFYVDTILIESDQSMDAYLDKLRKLLEPFPFIQSYTLKDFFPTHYSNSQARQEFFKLYAPKLEQMGELIQQHLSYSQLHSHYLNRISENFQTESADHHATRQLQIWIGFRNLLKHYFNAGPYIRLSSVYKDPSILDQMAINYLPQHHFEMPSFYCVARLKEGTYQFIKKQLAENNNFVLTEHQGYKFFQEI